MKICIIGCTGHVGYVFEGLNAEPGARVTGLAPGSEGEEVEKLLEPARQTGSSPRVFADFEHMLETEKPDVAVVAPRYCDHARAAAAALRAGCHVFVEKPVALTFADLAMLRRVHAESGRQLAPMLGLRYNPAFYSARRAVREGRIGEVRLLTAQKSYRLGRRPDFFARRSDYGGTIPWVGSHAIDLLAWFAGREFVSVCARHSRLHNRGNGDLEVSALCLFTMEDEVFAGANLDYLRPAGAPTHGDDRIRAAGTRGVVEVRRGRAYIVEEDVEGEGEIPLEEPPPIFADFLRAVRGEGSPLLTAEDAFRVTDACLRARLAADEGRPVAFSERFD